MTIAKEVVYALHKRLKDLSVNATPDQLAYLAKSLESIAGQSTVLDIVQMTDEKLGELLSSTRSHLSEINSNKENSISAITEARTESISEINTLRTSSLDALKESSDSHISLLDTRKNTNIAAINSTGTEQLEAIKGVVKQYETTVDVPSGSSIMKEIKPRAMIEPGSLPLLLGVLNRWDGYGDYGHGAFSNELGQWYKDTTKTDYMLQLLAGAHNYDTKYVGFYRPPRIHTLQGRNGTFIYREYHLRRDYSAKIIQYPCAILGVMFVKNTTSNNITRTLSFVGTSHWDSGYEGVGLFVGTPNNTNVNKEKISTITWTNIYNYSSRSRGFSASGSIIIPAGKTVVVLLYTTPYSESPGGNQYAQWMQWGIYNFRSNFLTAGLEVDIKRTLRAWQCPGLDATYKIWQ